MTLLPIATLSVACGGTAPNTTATDDGVAIPFGNLAKPSSEGERIRRKVPSPGPLEEAQWGDDLLIVAADVIPERLIERILAIQVRGGPGVAAAEQFSIGQIAVESRVLTLAAVDPGGYRRFTPRESAEFQEQWDRIANGEIAVLDELRRDLPIADGHLSVGSGDQVHDLHVGAFSPGQVGTIDAVVNEPWGAELGLPKGNALVVSTGLIAPQAVRDAIRELAPDLSITSLDIVDEAGIDPGATQRVRFVGTFADAVGDFSYTPIGGGRVAPAPAWVRAHIVTRVVAILGEVTCNRYLMPQLEAALAEVQSQGLADEIHPGEYAGCYYPRFIAGSTQLSNHAFGLALDLNVPGNQRGSVGEMNREVVAIFKRWGFAWGGDWNYTDPMHFELDRIVNPG